MRSREVVVHDEVTGGEERRRRREKCIVVPVNGGKEVLCGSGPVGRGGHHVLLRRPVGRRAGFEHLT